MRDGDVRKALLQELEARFAGDANTRIVEEMGVWSGSVRIDVAVINGALHGYELKSDRDTLKRLPYQADLYSRVFDQVTLVVGSRHSRKVTAMVPKWWGIIVATEGHSGIGLFPKRAPKQNPAPDPYLVAELLSKAEAISILEVYGLAKGWRSRKIREIHQYLARQLSFGDLAAHVRQKLKSRLRQSAAYQLDVPVYPNYNPKFQT